MSFFRSEAISIKFGGLQALDEVSFDVMKGEIFAIIGPNGAGKTTIFNCINRFYNLEKGHFFFKERDITHFRPHEVVDLGIARTFQNIELFRNMTVIENLLLGRHRHRRSNLLMEAIFSRKVRRQEVESREKAEEVIDFLDLQPYRTMVVGSLPYGIQKIVELGRALTIEPELLLLDEPSSGMNVEETDDLMNWITDIKEEMGITIILVEHNMRLVMEISDRVLALNFGKVLTQGKPREVQENPDVIKAYLGEGSVSIKG